MPAIDIQRQHDLGRGRAREIVADIAAAMQRKFAIDGSWEGDTLHVRRTGVEGSIEVGADRVRVRLRLGLMFGMLKGTIEDEIRRRLDQHFG